MTPDEKLDSVRRVSAVRRPNTGPYVVSCRDSLTGRVACRECHTWAFAVAVMRELLVAGYCDVSVGFV